MEGDTRYAPGAQGRRLCPSSNALAWFCLYTTAAFAGAWATRAHGGQQQNKGRCLQAERERGEEEEKHNKKKHTCSKTSKNKTQKTKNTTK